MDDVAKTDGVLDLRPARDSLVYQLLRLGLSFDHKDASGETWTDYRRGVVIRRPRSLSPTWTPRIPGRLPCPTWRMSPK